MSDLNAPKICINNENSATNYEMDGNIYGKSMPQSPAVSSETTSETQSVSDEPSQMVNINNNNPRKVQFINSSLCTIYHT